MKHEPDPLAIVAARIARRWRLICFDEFHVSDIADAMILGRLLGALFDARRRVRDDHQLRARRAVAERSAARALPADDRAPQAVARRGRGRRRHRLPAAGAGAGRDLARAARIRRPKRRSRPPSRRCAPGRTRIRSSRSKAGRSAREASRGSVVWFDFATLCDGPRSQRDYLELARRFSVLFLSGIPRLTPNMGDRARRFTWLVDILYDHRVKLLASAAARPDDLYPRGAEQPGIQPHREPARRDADPRLHGRAARRGRRSSAGQSERLRASNIPRTTTASTRRLHCRNSRRTGRFRKTTR